MKEKILNSNFRHNKMTIVPIQPIFSRKTYKSLLLLKTLSTRLPTKNSLKVWSMGLLQTGESLRIESVSSGIRKKSLIARGASLGTVEREGGTLAPESP